jgi:hypothetical protein
MGKSIINHTWYHSVETGDSGIEPFMKRLSPSPNATWARVKGFDGARRDGG